MDEVIVRLKQNMYDNSYMINECLKLNNFILIYLLPLNLHLPQF